MLMWTIVSGYFISITFEYLIVKLHKYNLSNKNMSVFEIILGWLFQEHVRQDFNMTGGKRFMLKIDFRNRFITQSIKIIRNVIFWIHVLNILELGTFILLFCFFLYIIVNKFHNYIIKIKKVDNIDFLKNIKSVEFIITFFFSQFLTINRKEILLFLSFLTFLNFIFFQTYGLFDFFFVLRPFLLLFYLFFNIISIFWVVYLIYNYTLKSFFGRIINVVIYKIHFYMIITYFILELIINEINFENITVQNFLKELLFKLVCFALNI